MSGLGDELDSEVVIGPDTLMENGWGESMREMVRGEGVMDGIWMSGRVKALIDLPRSEKSSRKILLLITAPSAGGKDMLRELIEETVGREKVSKFVTATTRKRRDEEREGVDYYFRTVGEFERLIKSEQLIEFIDLNATHPELGKRYMGLPNESVDRAMSNGAKVIVSHVEMASGWPAIGKYMKEKYAEVPVLRVFVMPEMKWRDYKDWLRGRRVEDWEPRLEKAKEELRAAGEADIIVQNPIPGLETIKKRAEGVVEILGLY